MAIRQKTNKKEWTKDGRSWYFDVSYYDITNNLKRKKSKLYKTKTQAKDAEREFLNKLSNNKVTSSGMKFRELRMAYYDFIKKEVKESSYNVYLRYKEYYIFFDKYDIDKLNIHIFEKWKEYINSGKIEKKNFTYEFSTNYKNTILTIFKAILNFGTKYYNINFSELYNKITEFKDTDNVKKEMDFYTLEEFKTFISYEDNLLWKAFFNTLYYMGYRKGEIRGLQWKDVDWKNKKINLNKQIPSLYGKNNWCFKSLKTKASYRILPINNIVYNLLCELYAYYKQATNFNEEWFIFGGVQPLGCDDIRYRRDRLCELSGVKHIRIHDFRHSCASLLMANGASVILIMKYLGHSRMDETINTYIHLFSSELNNVVEIIEKL